MKVHLTTVLLILSFSILSAQETATFNKNTTKEDKVTKPETIKKSSLKDTESNEKNEIRLNALSLLTGTAFDLSYEMVFTARHSLGVTLRFGFRDIEQTNREQLQNSSISLYYRSYFLKQRSHGSKGLFIEVFSSYVNLDSREDITSFNMMTYESGEKRFSQAENITSFAYGIGLGKKWINQNRFTFEVFAGVGGYTEEKIAYPLGRIEFSIGRRF